MFREKTRVALCQEMGRCSPNLFSHYSVIFGKFSLIIAQQLLMPLLSAYLYCLFSCQFEVFVRMQGMEQNIVLRTELF